jgi:hypothetical protein
VFLVVKKKALEKLIKERISNHQERKGIAHKVPKGISHKD